MKGEFVGMLFQFAFVLDKRCERSIEVPDLGKGEGAIEVCLAADPRVARNDQHLPCQLKGPVCPMCRGEGCDSLNDHFGPPFVPAIPGFQERIEDGNRKVWFPNQGGFDRSDREELQGLIGLLFDEVGDGLAQEVGHVASQASAALGWGISHPQGLCETQCLGSEFAAQLLVLRVSRSKLGKRLAGPSQSRAGRHTKPSEHVVERVVAQARSGRGKRDLQSTCARQGQPVVAGIALQGCARWIETVRPTRRESREARARPGTGGSPATQGTRRAHRWPARPRRCAPEVRRDPPRRTSSRGRGPPVSPGVSFQDLPQRGERDSQSVLCGRSIDFGLQVALYAPSANGSTFVEGRVGNNLCVRADRCMPWIQRFNAQLPEQLDPIPHSPILTGAWELGVVL